MNITSNTFKIKDEMVKYLIKSQHGLIKECHDDFKTQKFQEAISRLRAKNKLQNAI